MSKTLIYNIAIISFFAVSFMGKPINSYRNLEIDNSNLILKNKKNKANSKLMCASYFSIINYSGYAVTSVKVQYGGVTQTYDNPTFPINFLALGYVTILVKFVRNGKTGGIQSYDDTSGSEVLIDCESYNTNYLSPIVIHADFCNRIFRTTITRSECD